MKLHRILELEIIPSDSNGYMCVYWCVVRDPTQKVKVTLGIAENI